ncbi:MAG: crossover junction endodeoxyribonuclease RuvC [Chloroflexi bacterium]|nr:crossover junction endodeoxyribonuclease RuvC [Chloroflexota bacterium]
MLVLGIDPGVAITGYGVVEQGRDQLSLVACGVVTTPPHQPLAERLRTIYQELSDLIGRYRPEAVAVEELFFGRNVRTAISVGHARGVALLAAALADLPVFTYTPTAVKMAIIGYGGASKRQMQEMVRMLLGLPDVPRPDDAADAIAVAICHIHSAQWDQMAAAAGDS